MYYLLLQYKNVDMTGNNYCAKHIKLKRISCLGKNKINAKRRFKKIVAQYVDNETTETWQNYRIKDIYNQLVNEGYSTFYDYEKICVINETDMLNYSKLEAKFYNLKWERENGFFSGFKSTLHMIPTNLFYFIKIDYKKKRGVKSSYRINHLEEEELDYEKINDDIENVSRKNSPRENELDEIEEHNRKIMESDNNYPAYLIKSVDTAKMELEEAKLEMENDDDEIDNNENIE